MFPEESLQTIQEINNLNHTQTIHKYIKIGVLVSHFMKL